VNKIVNPRDILLRPVISEKSLRLADDGKYTFVVAPEAHKTQIRQAVEATFNVKVTGVNTANRLGKRPDTKRAIVSLAAGDRIEQFGGPVS
jgi:large subunit ribosomal protein L23